MLANSDLSFKLCLGADIRRLCLPLSSELFAEVLRQTATLFSLSVPLNDIKLRYINAMGDLITCSSSREFRSALQHFDLVSAPISYEFFVILVVDLVDDPDDHREDVPYQRRNATEPIVVDSPIASYSLRQVDLAPTLQSYSQNQSLTTVECFS